VVYVVSDNVAHAHPVKTGIQRDGVIEILDGIQPGWIIAVDGAALLSDGAKVNVRATTPASSTTRSAPGP
jgi:multidrug efflux pump subunit AcrA (membrane-fusion protein)